MKNITYPQTWRQHLMDDFSYGLNIDSPEKGVGFKKAFNADIDRDRNVLKRSGYERVNTFGTYIVLNASNNGIRTIYEFVSRLGWTATKYLFLTFDGKIVKTDQVATDTLEFDGTTELKTGCTVDSEWSWGTLANKAFFVCSDNNFWTDGTNVRENGVVGPSAAPSAAEAASGSIAAGEYLVRYSYVRSGNYGYETTASATVTVTVTGGSKKIQVTVVASADAQIDKINLYVSSSKGTVCYYQQQENNASTTYDITSLTVGGNVAPTDNGVPPNAKILKIGGSRAWYINTDDAEGGSSKAVYSHINQPEAVGANSYVFYDQNDGLEITGAGIAGDWLVVFKRDKTFLTDLWNQSVVHFSKTVGCLTRFSVQEVEDKKGVVFLSNSLEIKLFDGTGIVNLTKDRISTLLQEIIDETRLDEVRSIYDPTSNKYSIVLPVLGGKYRQFNCFFDHGSAWTEYGLFYPTAMALATDENGTSWVVSGRQRSTIGHILKHNTTASDDTNDIKMELKTVPFNFGLLGIMKTLQRAYMKINSYDPVQNQTLDDDLWGYLFDSEENDSIVASPYGVGSATASSVEGTNTAAKAFDGNTATRWQSKAGAATGLKVTIKPVIGNFIFGGYNVLALYAEYAGTEWVYWDWGAGAGYKIYAVKITPNTSGVKDFLFQGSNDASAWETLIDGTCTNDDTPYAYEIPEGSDKYRYIRVLVETTYSSSTASIKELNVIVYDDVNMQGYIFSKNVGSVVRKTTFQTYTDMDGFLTDWKSNNTGWASSYEAATATFDIDDNSSIETALSFLSSGSLDNVTMVNVDANNLLAINSGNLIFMTYVSGDVTITVKFYKDAGNVLCVSKEVDNDGVENYLVDAWWKKGVEIQRVNLTGKGEDFSFSFEEESSKIVVLEAVNILFFLLTHLGEVKTELES